jgi:hypothetical protein
MLHGRKFKGKRTAELEIYCGEVQKKNFTNLTRKRKKKLFSRII